MHYNKRKPTKEKQPPSPPRPPRNNNQTKPKRNRKLSYARIEQRIMEWFVLEETLNIIQFQPPALGRDNIVSNKCFGGQSCRNFEIYICFEYSRLCPEQ